MNKNEHGNYVSIKFVGDILYVKFKKGKRIDIWAAKEIVRQRMEFHKDKSLPIICDVSNVKFVDLAAREYLAMEGSIFVKVLAIIAKQKTAEVMVKHYLNSYPAPMPIKLFSNKIQATEFIMAEVAKIGNKNK